MEFIKKIILVALFVLVIDSLWIGLFIKNEYSRMILEIQKAPMRVRIIPTMITYLTIILPLVLFVIPNIKPKSRFLDSIYYGGLFGLFSYGMFSMTNYSIIDNWSLRVAILDTIWGFILFSLVSYFFSYFDSYFA